MVYERRTYNQLLHTMIRAIILLFISVYLFVGCADSNKPDNTVPMKLPAPEVTQVTVEYLEQNQIWYEVIDTDILSVPYPPPDGLIEFVNSEMFKFFPQDRALSYNDEIFELVKRRITEDGIAFTTICFDKIEYIIWENDNDRLRIEEIASEIGLDYVINHGSIESDRYGSPCM